MITQFAPSLTIVHQEPAVAGSMTVPAVLDPIGTTLLDADTTNCATVFLTIISSPGHCAAIGSVIVIVPANDPMSQFCPGCTVSDAAEIVTGALRLSEGMVHMPTPLIELNALPNTFEAVGNRPLSRDVMPVLLVLTAQNIPSSGDHAIPLYPSCNTPDPTTTRHIFPSELHNTPSWLLVRPIATKIPSSAAHTTPRYAAGVPCMVPTVHSVPFALYMTLSVPPNAVATNRDSYGDQTTPNQFEAGAVRSVQSTPFVLVMTCCAPVSPTATNSPSSGDQQIPFQLLSAGVALVVHTDPFALVMILEPPFVPRAKATNKDSYGDQVTENHSSKGTLTCDHDTPSKLRSTRFVPVDKTATNWAVSADQHTLSMLPTLLTF